MSDDPFAGITGDTAIQPITNQERATVIALEVGRLHVAQRQSVMGSDRWHRYARRIQTEEGRAARLGFRVSGAGDQWTAVPL